MSANLLADVERPLPAEDEMLEDFLTQAVEVGAELGAQLDLHWGFEGLKDIPDREQPLFPGYDPDYGATGFWFSVRDAERGPESPIVGHFAAYALSIYPLNLADYIAQHSMYTSTRDHFVLEEPARGVAERINDMAVFIGCYWMHPDYRRSALTRYLSWTSPMMLAAVGHAKWAAPHYFGFFKEGLAGSVLKRSRMLSQVPGVYWYRDGVPYGGVRYIGHLPAELALRDIDTFVRTRRLSEGTSTRTSLDRQIPSSRS